MTKKKNPATGNGPKRKPGPEGNFHGLRLEYLTSHLAGYQKAVIDKTTRDFWQPVLSGYWQRVEWRKSLDEETDGDAFRDASLTAEEVLSEEDTTKKAETISKVNSVCIFLLFFSFSHG
jgi:hypothetical protein